MSKNRITNYDLPLESRTICKGLIWSKHQNPCDHRPENHQIAQKDVKNPNYNQKPQQQNTKELHKRLVPNWGAVVHSFILVLQCFSMAKPLGHEGRGALLCYSNPMNFHVNAK